MHLPKLLLAILSLIGVQCAVANPGTHKPHGPEMYRAFLDQYRLEHPNLRPEQLATIDKASNLAKNHKQLLTPEADADIRKEFKDLFGEQEGLYLANPKYKPNGERNSRRAGECECSQESDKCDDGGPWYCTWRVCDEKSDYGCGTARSYPCDGGCVKDGA